MREAQLPTAYGQHILPFWKENGRALRFSSALDGLALAGMAFAQPSRGTAIVISSGRAESYLKYKELIYDLYQAGNSIYILDHRGQGLSGRILADDTKRQIGYVRTFGDYVADLRQFFLQFVQPAGYRHHVLLCHSMGGCIGSVYLETYPQDFTCAVLSSPMHQPATGAVPAVVAEGLLDLLILGGRGEDYVPGKGDYDDNAVFAGNELTQSEIRWRLTRREYAETPAVKLGGPSAHWLRAALEAGETARQNAATIAVPVLLLQAGVDEVVSLDAQKEFCDRLNQARTGACRLERIAGASHELFVEADVYRQPALNLVLEFIRNCTGAG